MLNKYTIALLGSFLVLGTGCPKNPVSLKPIELLQPTLGQLYHFGQTRTIKWRVNDKVKIDAIGVKLSLDSGKTFPISIDNGPIPSSDSVIAWEIINTQVSTQCVIKVFKYSDESAYNDKSGVFTVDSVPLVLLDPLGGENFKVGETVPIKWTIHDKSQVGSVAIKYSLSVGSNWSVNDIGDKSFSYPDTSYLWTITDTYKSNQFALKIYEYNNHTPSDSSARFVIRQ